MSDNIVGDTPELTDLDDIPPLPVFPPAPGALTQAASQGDLSSIQALFEDPEAISEQDRHDAMASAVHLKDISIVSYLLSKTILPSVDDIIAAINHKAIHILKAFFENDDNLINQPISNDFPPFLAYVLHFIHH